MALIHHDSRNYNEAASEAAKWAREKLQEQIDSGVKTATAVLEQIERDVPQDRIVRGRAVDFVPVAKGVDLLVDDRRTSIHDHALGQVAQRAGIPMTYVRALQGEEGWAPELLAHNLKTLYRNGDRAKNNYLQRDIGIDGNGAFQTRGWLSDRYRRLDSRPLVEAFVNSVSEFGAVIIKGSCTPTKVALKAVLPVIFEPVTNEVCCYGVEWSNSDFGDGKLMMREVLDRLACTNLMRLQDAMNQRHVGGKLDDNFEYSKKTYELDQKTTVSAMKDMVHSMFAPDRVHKTVNLIAKANEEEIDPWKLSSYIKKQLTKGEHKQIVDTFNSADVVQLPPGNTKWRLSNAIALVARDCEDQRRALDLESVAGKVLV